MPVSTIKEVPVSNKKILAETAALSRVDLEMTEDIIKFVGEYIAARITEGRMEEVMIPYFGKFVPRIDVIKKRTQEKMERANGLDKIKRALKGKPDLKYPTTNKDEII